MLHFDSESSTNIVHLDFGAALPRTLTLLPSDVEVDGTFTVRGMSSGRINTFDSPLALAVALSIEANPQLLDLVTFDDVLTGQGPDWATRIADRLDGGPAPTLLVRADVGCRIMEQAVTVESKHLADCRSWGNPADQRQTYRGHGVAWSHRTEDHVSPGRTASLLWLSQCLESPVPAAAKDAILTTMSAFGNEVALSTILLHAALVAGVSTPTILATFGHLVVAREIDVDLDGGVIVTDKRICRASGHFPHHVCRTWLDAFVGNDNSSVAELGLI